MTPVEIEYSPSSRVASLDDEIARYRAASDVAIRLPHQIVPTGEQSDEFVVMSTYRRPAEGARLHHGGYWQALSAWEST